MHTLIEAPDGLYLYSDINQIAFHPLDFHEYYQNMQDLSSIGKGLISQYGINEINTLINMQGSFFDIEQYRRVRSVHKFGCFNFASFYSKKNVEYDLGKEDNLIVQSIEYIESMEKELEKEVKGLGEIYTVHNCIAEAVWVMNKYKEKVESFIESVYEGTVEENMTFKTENVKKYVKHHLRHNMIKSELAKLLSHPSLTNIPVICVSLCESIINKRIILTSLYAYLQSKLELISPNLLALLGSRVAAELIAKAGSLTALSKCPSSTLQLLGAEKALFRALKNKTNTPKHGVLYRHGRLARTVACKASIAARIDCYAITRTNEYGLEMRKLIEQKELGLRTENTDTVLKRVFDKLKEEENKKTPNKDLKKKRKKESDGTKKKRSSEQPLETTIKKNKTTQNAQDNLLNIAGKEFKLLNRSKLNDSIKKEMHEEKTKKEKSENKKSKTEKKSKRNKKDGLFDKSSKSKISAQIHSDFPSSDNSNIFSTPTLIMDSGGEKIEHAESKSKGKNKKSATDNKEESLSSSVSNTKRKAAVTRVVTKESEKKKLDAATKKVSKKTRVKKANEEDKKVSKKEEKKADKKGDKKDIKKEEKKTKKTKQVEVKESPVKEVPETKRKSGESKSKKKVKKV